MVCTGLRPTVASRNVSVTIRPPAKTPTLGASGLSMSADGRRFIVHAEIDRRWTGDFWVPENFLPPAPGIPAAGNKAGK